MFGWTKHPQGFFDILKEDTDMSVSSFFDPNQSHTCLNLFKDDFNLDLRTKLI